MSAEWITAAGVIVGAIVAILEWRLRAQSATIIEKLDDRYIRKPENSEDFPVSRRELEYRLRNGVRL